MALNCRLREEMASSLSCSSALKTPAEIADDTMEDTILSSLLVASIFVQASWTPLSSINVSSYRCMATIRWSVLALEIVTYRTNSSKVSRASAKWKWAEGWVRGTSPTSLILFRLKVRITRSWIKKFVYLFLHLRQGAFQTARIRRESSFRGYFMSCKFTNPAFN